MTQEILETFRTGERWAGARPPPARVHAASGICVLVYRLSDIGGCDRIYCSVYKTQTRGGWQRRDAARGARGVRRAPARHAPARRLELSCAPAPRPVCGTGRHPSPSGPGGARRGQSSDRQSNATAYRVLYTTIRLRIILRTTTYYILVGTLVHSLTRHAANICGRNSQVAPRLLGMAGRLRFTIPVTPRARRAS